MKRIELKPYLVMRLADGSEPVLLDDFDDMDEAEQYAENVNELDRDEDNVEGDDDDEEIHVVELDEIREWSGTFMDARTPGEDKSYRCSDAFDDEGE